MRISIDDTLYLDEFSLEDADELAFHLNHETIYLNTLKVPYPYSPEDARNWIGSLLEKKTEGAQVSDFAIRHQGQLGGGIGLLHHAEPWLNHKAGIGYWMAEGLRNKGLMTKVVEHFCRWAFSTYPFVKLDAMVYPHNTASEKVLLKNGFIQEAYFHKHLKKQDKYIDCKVFGLFKETLRNG